MTPLEAFMGLSPDVTKYENQQENLGKFTENVGQAKMEIVENFQQPGGAEGTATINDPETIDFATALEIADNNEETVTNDTIKIEKGKEAQEIMVNDTAYHISITPQKSPKDTTRGYIVIKNQETQQAKKVGTVSIDLNRFGRWFGGDTVNKMDTKGTSANWIDSLYVTDSTLLIHGKMEIERDGKKFIEDYKVELNRNPFDSLLQSHFFGKENKTLHLDVEKFFEENPKLYNTLAEKYGSIVTSLAKKGITSINFMLETAAEDHIVNDKTQNDEKSETDFFQNITNKNE